MGSLLSCPGPNGQFFVLSRTNDYNLRYNERQGVTSIYVVLDDASDSPPCLRIQDKSALKKIPFYILMFIYTYHIDKFLYVKAYSIISNFQRGGRHILKHRG